MEQPVFRWSVLRGLGYFFGNRDVCEELTRLRSDNFEMRERLLEKNHVRGLAQPVDKTEVQETEPQDDYEGWKQRREAELVELKALDAAKDAAILEEYTYFAEIDPELWNPVLVKAAEIQVEIAKGTYREPQER